LVNFCGTFLAVPMVAGLVDGESCRALGGLRFGASEWCSQAAAFFRWLLKKHAIEGVEQERTAGREQSGSELRRVTHV
jgi:hypothetical protein